MSCADSDFCISDFVACWRMQRHLVHSPAWAPAAPIQCHVLLSSRLAPAQKVFPPFLEENVFPPKMAEKHDFQNGGIPPKMDEKKRYDVTWNAAILKLNRIWCHATLTIMRNSQITN